MAAAVGLSEKQLQVLAFPRTGYDALVCDGSVRSGKSSVISVAFVDWAMRTFSGQRLGICGKTIDAARKNVVEPYMAMTWPTRHMGYQLRWRGGENVLEVTWRGRTNSFEVFGGKDEGSRMLIQGRTLAGVLMDEVALMPRSFVEQAIARCSVPGSRLWFDCNPEGPTHWFKQEWIDGAAEKNALRLHFTMADNPGLTPEVRARYERMYSGVFYRRYVLGEWVRAEGLVYPDHEAALEGTWRPDDGARVRWAVSIDYGTQNAFAALLWACQGGVWHAVREFYYSGRTEGHQMTDADYAGRVEALCAGVPGEVEVIVDPSATSFMAELRRRGQRFRVRHARNDVADGIRETAACMQAGLVRIGREACPALVRELGGYVWDEAHGDGERPLKVDDHACDALRYLVATERVIRAVESPEEYRSVFGR